MADFGARLDSAMKRDVSINGRPARLIVEGSHLRYELADGQAIERDFSIEPAGPGMYSVLLEGRSYGVSGRGPGEVRVNGRSFTVEVFDPREFRTRKNTGENAGRVNLAALMPGKVIRLLARPGDSVQEGQGLIVVEAMKMQNEMKSPKAGRVIEVKTAADANVAAGDVLVVIE
jgi:acetyl/propionyl-CoA carboxylase alpha subunit